MKSPDTDEVIVKSPDADVVSMLPVIMKSPDTDVVSMLPRLMMK